MKLNQNCPICLSKLTNIDKNFQKCYKCEYMVEVGYPNKILGIRRKTKQTIFHDYYIREPEKILKLYRSFLNKDKDKISPYLNYGYYTEENKNNRHTNLLIKILDSVELDNKQIVELSCGRGGNLNYIQKNYRNCKIFGIDITEENIIYCLDNSEKNIIYYVGDVELVPFNSEKMDVVINIESSIHYSNFRQFSINVFNMLRTDGDFLYADIIENSKIQEVKNIFENIGFQIISLEDLTYGVIQSLIISRKNNSITTTNSDSFFDKNIIFKKMQKNECKYYRFHLKKI